MFTNVNFTEKIEDHLDSSFDSVNGSDSSFEDEPEHKYSPPSVSEMKFKQVRYQNYQKKITNTKKELQENKTGSMWKSLYYTFFGTNSSSSVTLSELDLRLKFLSKREEITKDKKEDKKRKKNQIKLNTDEFIKVFNQFDEDNNVYKKIIQQKINERKEKGQSQNPKRRSVVYRKGLIPHREKSSNSLTNIRYIRKQSVKNITVRCEVTPKMKEKIKINLANLIKQEQQQKAQQQQEEKKEIEKEKDKEKETKKGKTESTNNGEENQKKSIFELYEFNKNLEDLAHAYQKVKDAIFDLDNEEIPELLDDKRLREDYKKNLKRLVEGEFCYETILNEFLKKISKRKEIDDSKETKDILNFLYFAEIPKIKKGNLFDNFKLDSVRAERRLAKEVNKLRENYLSKIDSHFKIEINK